MRIYGNTTVSAKRSATYNASFGKPRLTGDQIVALAIMAGKITKKS